MRGQRSCRGQRLEVSADLHRVCGRRCAVAHTASSTGSARMAPGVTYPPIVSVLGESGSGKTMLLVGLIRRLTARGIRCGAIKRGHHLTPDVEGKDTARFAAAGASPVAGLGPDNAVLHGVVLTVPEILAIMAPRVHLIVAEGLRRDEVDGFILVGDDPRPVPGRIIARVAAVDDDVIAWLAEMLAAQVGETAARAMAADSRRSMMIELKVNGQEVPLNRFVSQLLEAQIRATVRTLRDIPDEVEEIVLKVNAK